MSKVILNEKQQQAYDFIASRLDQAGKDNYIYCIEGKAGSGKTTLAARIIKAKRHKHRFVIMAPSHSARAMVLQSLRKEGVDVRELESTTVQAFVGMQPDRREEPTRDEVLEEKFATLGKPKTEGMDGDTVILVDEISMISKDMMVKMLRAISGVGARCIMMGDYNQIPPVKDESSQPIVDAMKLKRKEYCFELEVNERADATTDIDSTALGVLVGKPPRNGRGVTVVGSHKELVAAFTEAAEQGLRPYGVAYRNADVNSMNELARNTMGHDLTFKNGDVVRLDGMGISFYDRERGENGEKVIVAYPGEFITLRDVSDEHLYGFQGFERVVPVQTFKLDTFEYQEFQCTRLDEWDDKRSKNLKIYLQNNLDLVKEAIRQISRGGRLTDPVLDMLKDEAHFSFPSMRVITGKYDWNLESSTRLIWANNFFGHRENFLRMSHQFASTTHKSQGQTRPHVFVDARGMDPRMLYVAISRASESVTIYLGKL